MRKQAGRDSQIRKTAAKVLRAQNKNEKAEKAKAEHAANKAAWELERDAVERVWTARRAEAAEVAAAVGKIPLQVGVDPLDHNRRTTRSASKPQVHAFFAANEQEQATKAFVHREDTR
jgi:hypothetical protein